MLGEGRNFCEFYDVEVCAFPGFAFEDVAYLTGVDGVAWE